MPQVKQIQPMTFTDSFGPSDDVPAVPLTAGIPIVVRAAGEPVNVLELTQAIRCGDEQAFARFYDLYSFRLYKYLLVLCKGNEVEARAVLQTVAIKLARGFEVFDDEARLWKWLRCLARNAFVDHYRALRRDHRYMPLDALVREPVEETGEDDRMSAAVRQAVQQLEPDEGEFIRAVYVDECGLQAIADETGQTYKAVESRLARLRQKLKTVLLNILRHE